MGWTADHLALPAEWLEFANTGCSHFLLGTSHLHFGNRCIFPIFCGLVDVVPAPPLKAVQRFQAAPFVPRYGKGVLSLGRSPCTGGELDTDAQDVPS